MKDSTPSTKDRILDHLATQQTEYHSRKQALGLLRKSGDDEIADLLAEKHDDPVVAELARFLTTVGFYG
jgi:hypothetical protein